MGWAHLIPIINYYETLIIKKQRFNKALILKLQLTNTTGYHVTNIKDHKPIKFI